jgi:hypothetical protein
MGEAVDVAFRTVIGAVAIPALDLIVWGSGCW